MDLINDFTKKGQLREGNRYMWGCGLHPHPHISPSILFAGSFSVRALMRYFSRSHNRSQNLRPPDLYEYFVDNFWFEGTDLENRKITESLLGSHKAGAASSPRVFMAEVSSWWWKTGGIRQSIKYLLQQRSLGIEPADWVWVRNLIRNNEKLFFTPRFPHPSSRGCEAS